MLYCLGKRGTGEGGKHISALDSLNTKRDGYIESRFAVPLSL